MLGRLLRLPAAWWFSSSRCNVVLNVYGLSQFAFPSVSFSFLLNIFACALDMFVFPSSLHLPQPADILKPALNILWTQCTGMISVVVSTVYLLYALQKASILFTGSQESSVKWNLLLTLLSAAGHVQPVSYLCHNFLFHIFFGLLSATNPNACRATGRGLQPKGVRVKEVADFKVFTKGAGSGALHVSVKGPSESDSFLVSAHLLEHF